MLSRNRVIPVVIRLAFNSHAFRAALAVPIAVVGMDFLFDVTITTAYQCRAW